MSVVSEKILFMQRFLLRRAVLSLSTEALIDRGEPDIPLKMLTIWTSTRKRTVETGHILEEKGYRVRQRSQLSQINPGVCEKKSEKRIRIEYPDEVAKHEADPYHHRYPRAEVSDLSSQYMLCADSPSRTTIWQ